MDRYRVAGSNFDAACSVDCIAQSAEAAIEVFREEMGKDLPVYSWGDPIVVNLDKMPNWVSQGSKDWLFASWKEGRVWKFDGY